MTSYFRQIDRMLEQHNMPPEYEHFWSIVLCNDCEKKSKTKYHFLYHKCQECDSYNTKVIQTVQERPNADGTGSTVVPIDTTNLLGLTSETLSPGSARGRSVSSASSTTDRFMVPDDNETRSRPN